MLSLYCEGFQYFKVFLTTQGQTKRVMIKIKCAILIHPQLPRSPVIRKTYLMCERQMLTFWSAQFT